MEYFRFTLFNNITLLVMALTGFLAIARWRIDPRSNWPLLYYAVAAVYTLGFEGSFNRFWLAAGLVSGLLVRVGWARARWLEALFFLYVLWRSVGLLLMW